MTESTLYYSLIQVVPDPVRGERMNVGVVAWDPADKVGAMRFSRSRMRLRALGLQNLAFLTEFEAWLEHAIKAADVAESTPTEKWSLEAMQTAATEWGGMIQLTPPLPSVGGSVEELARQAYDRAVFVRKARVDPESGRQALRQSAAQIVRHSLRERFGSKLPIEVSVSSEVQGRLYAHVFDLVMSNGEARGVLITPNFADPRTEQVRRDLDAAAWAIQDVISRENGARPEFGILAAGPMRPTLSAQLDAIVDDLRVAPLQREDLPRWATEDVLTPAAS